MAVSQSRDPSPGITAFRYHTRVRGAYLAWMWNMPAWFLALVGYVEWSDRWWRGLVFVPAAIGAALAWAALRRYVRYRKDGPAVLYLEPPRPRIGASFGARIVAARPVEDGRVFRACLRCQKTRYGHEAASSRTIWADEKPMAVCGGVAEAKFLTPADLPSSRTDADQPDTSFGWTIDLDRGGYRQEYTIILEPARAVEQPTRRKSRHPRS